MDIDPNKALAALEQLEAEKERRLQERIASGEALSVPLVMVVEAPLTDEQIESAKAWKLAQLRADGERREIVFDVTTVVTGVPRATEAEIAAHRDAMDRHHEKAKQNQQASDGQTSVDNVVKFPKDDPVSESPRGEEPVAGGAILSPAPQPETYVWATLRPANDDGDLGQIAEGFYSVEDGNLVLVDGERRHLASRRLRAGEDARDVARELLRKAAPNDFYRSIKYPGLGIV